MEGVEALELAGNADGIYPAWYLDDARAAKAEDGDRLRQARDYAARERVKLSRRAILYSAFAAEAFVNEFMTMYFDGRDLETLDRLATVEKYVLVPRVALGETLFDRATEPTQTLRRLFALRSTLVHPKPGKRLPVPSPAAADPTFKSPRGCHGSCGGRYGGRDSAAACADRRPLQPLRFRDRNRRAGDHRIRTPRDAGTSGSK